jgi:bifunctional DNase/RNase
MLARRRLYADEIEEADNTVRKARVNALFGGTAMAALLAASDGASAQQSADPSSAEIVSLADVRSSEQQTAAASD